MNRSTSDAGARGWLWARVVGWLIVPLYLAGIRTSYLLERDAGLPNENPVENAALIAGFGTFAVVGSLPVTKRPTNLTGWIMAAVAFMVGIFHAGDACAERQQMKWFVYAATLLLLAPAVNFLPDVINGVWLGLVLIATSTAIGIAVLRYWLYEIDILINRTLVYGPLTAMALFYLGGVVSLQYAFHALTGQESQVAVVASTLAIAALFSPLRRRVQAFVDRRFYGRKYDARKTMETFSAKLRDETDLERLGGELVGAVRETMQPAHVSLWLRPSRGTMMHSRPGGSEAQDV